MVALNESFAPEKPALGSKNRVGNFFGRSGDRVGENRPATRNRIGEKRPKLTIIASGRPVWPSRDPLGEYGGLNLYAFIFNYATGYVDRLGLMPGPYSSEQTAAEAAVEKALRLFHSDPKNAKKGIEFCGYILKKCEKGKLEFSYNGPFRGEEPNSCTPRQDFSEPWRFSNNSIYHTHPGSNDGFSADDINWPLLPGGSNWRGDPDGGLHQWQKPPLPPSCINQCGDIDITNNKSQKDFEDYYNNRPKDREIDHGIIFEFKS